MKLLGKIANLMLDFVWQVLGILVIIIVSLYIVIFVELPNIIFTFIKRFFTRKRQLTDVKDE